MEHRNFDKEVVQNAIWTISDKHNVSNIPDSTEALQSLRVFLAQLSGQILPWYHLEMRSGRTGNGSLWQQAQRLRASIVVSNEKEDYVTLTVLNKDGVPCAKILQHWLKAGQGMRYEVEVPVNVLPGGEYSLVLESKTRTLFREVFVI